MHKIPEYLFSLLLFVFAGNSIAYSSTTDVSVSLGSTIQLFCYENVDVNLNPGNLFNNVTRRVTTTLPGQSHSASLSGDDLTVTIDPTSFEGTGVEPQTRIFLFLRTICSYRTYGAVTGATVEIQTLESRLETSGGSFIDVLNTRTRDSINRGVWRSTFTVSPADLATTPIRGLDVRLRLDISNANEPALYSSPTDGTFRITVLPSP